MNQDKAGGKDKFGRALKICSDEPSFNSISRIVIIADNDDDPIERFESIRAQLAAKGFQTAGAPEAIFAQTRPSIQIIMIPFDAAHGNLESLCKDAVADHSLIGPINNYVALTPPRNWPVEVSDKAWLRSYLAVACRRDPFVTLADAISMPEHAALLDFNIADLVRLRALINP